MKVAFDSRPAKDTGGIGRYTSSLLAGLRSTGGGEIVESNSPRRCDVFHAPWIEGALLRPPVPMVVTLHDLIPLKRRSEYLRTGIRFKLRYLAVQRAVRVIVPTNAVADDATRWLGIPAERLVVIKEAAATGLSPRSDGQVRAVRKRYGLPGALPAVGRRTANARSAQACGRPRAGHPHDAARAWSDRPAGGRGSYPTSR